MSLHEIRCPKCGKKQNGNEVKFSLREVIRDFFNEQKRQNIKIAEFENILALGIISDVFFDLSYNEICAIAEKKYDYDDRSFSVPDSDDCNDSAWQDKLREKESNEIIVGLKINQNFVRLYKTTEIFSKMSDIDIVKQLSKGMIGSKRKEIEEIYRAQKEVFKEIIRKMLDTKLDDKLLCEITLGFKLDTIKENWLLQYVQYGSIKTEQRKCACCSSILSSIVGFNEEKLIGLAGIKGAAKSSYLAALLSSLLNDRCQYSINADPDDEKGEGWLLISEYLQRYDNGLAPDETNKDAFPDFSLEIKYGKAKPLCLTFIDIPGELLDPEDGQSVDYSKRLAIGRCNLIWLCVSAEHFFWDSNRPREAKEKCFIGNTTALTKYINDLKAFLDNIHKDDATPIYLLITKTDLVRDYYNKLSINVAESENPHEAARDDFGFICPYAEDEASFARGPKDGELQDEIFSRNEKLFHYEKGKARYREIYSRYAGIPSAAAFFNKIRYIVEEQLVFPIAPYGFPAPTTIDAWKQSEYPGSTHAGRELQEAYDIKCKPLFNPFGIMVPLIWGLASFGVIATKCGTTATYTVPEGSCPLTSVVGSVPVAAPEQSALSEGGKNKKQGFWGRLFGGSRKKRHNSRGGMK